MAWRRQEAGVVAGTANSTRMNTRDMFADTLERVRQLMQQQRRDDAIATIDAALRGTAQHDKLLFLRLDIARNANDATLTNDTLARIGELARSDAAIALRCVSSQRLRGLAQPAWDLLAQFPTNTALAGEAYHLGLDFTRRQQPAIARDCYAYALACHPGFAEAHVNLGHLLLGEHRFLEAQPHFEAAARLQPLLQGAWIGLGQCLLNTGRGAQALDAFAHIGDTFADGAQLLAWRATATAQSGDDDAAIALYRQALDRDTHLYDAWFGSALIHERRGDLEAAANAYAQAWMLRPQTNWALGSYVYCLQCMADWPRLQAPCVELLRRLAHGDVGDYATALSSLDLPGRALRDVAAQFMRTQSALCVMEARERSFPPRKPGRLRIGYLSTDFRDHATSRLLIETLEHHDRERFELFGFALNPPDGSALGRRVVAAFEHFVEAAELSTTEIAARILDAGIDVLIDLNGHTKGSRIGLAALRPAPVIVNYLGYPGTMGDYVDYIIGDRYVTPVGSEEEFSETVVRLPVCYQPNDRLREVGPLTQRMQHGLPDDAIVACSFNQSWKITPPIWAIWMRLLRAHPRLVLWLLDENPWFKQNLHNRAAEAGIDAERIVFAPRVSQAEHLVRLALADIALDTVPCNSHTTGSDALWMGVPMVTLVGDSFAGRVGASLLHAVGLPELIAYDEAGYAATLDALVGAPDELARLKTTLLARRNSAELFDSAATARALEQAYLAMHERHRL
jgi:protein O-GlcNAc transferase